MRCVVKIMCQLLGMNSLKPAELSFSLAGFLRRGGETDDHADGWGIALYEEERACKLVVEEQASARSVLARSIQQHTGRSCNIIAHIRKATQGDISVENCHPFMRELWGREWSFAHNGNLDKSLLYRPTHFKPYGQTDSELAFCLIFDALVERFGEVAPDVAELHEALQAITRSLAVAGRFNYMLSDGHMLFAHRSTELHYVERAWPFGHVHLIDCPLGIDLAQLNKPDDRMIIIATRPLTDECWQPLPVGEVTAFVDGRRLI